LQDRFLSAGQLFGPALVLSVRDALGQLVTSAAGSGLVRNPM
jgi:hypothetical protein